MPLYDFSCHACGGRFEARIPSDSAASCPDCGSTHTERLLSLFAGPFTVAPRGQAARRSNATRRDREEQRQERREERRRKPADGGGS
jgi:putative FmdB family regulatory protein